MSTTVTDRHAFYGVYICKATPVVHASLARMLERERNELSTRLQIAEGEIERAHRVLDEIGVPRLQLSDLSYSLEGRLNFMRGDMK